MAGRNRQSPRWSFLSWFDITDRSDPQIVYLRRLRIVECPLFGLYIHWIKLPDSGLHPHDHPWPFLSIVARGGYTESVHTNVANLRAWMTRRRRLFSAQVFPLDHAHHIDEVKPHTITVVMRGRRRKSWGFWTGDNTIVDWSDYFDATPDPFSS